MSRHKMYHRANRVAKDAECAMDSVNVQKRIDNVNKALFSARSDLMWLEGAGDPVADPATDAKSALDQLLKRMKILGDAAKA